MTNIQLVHDTPASVPGYVCNGGYDENNPDSFHLEYAPRTESVAEAIVKAAAFVHNVDHRELTPLATVIDPDSIDELVGPQSPSQENEVEISFTYEDLEITVNNCGDIWLKWV